MESFDNTINQDEEHTNSPITTNSKLEIGDEFLKILQDNDFNDIDGGDVTNHIAKDLAETMIWYMLKKTCVELIRAF
ncbi:hypothetical protein Tco_0429552 [Tanacetum coccineum]